MKTWLFWQALIFSLLLLAACGSGEDGADYIEPEPDGFSVLEDNPLADIKFFAYQIQDISNEDRLNELVSSHYDLVVIEPTRTDITGDADFDTKSAVESLKDSKASDGTSGKMVIAYIDIGEVEDWRWYWNWSKVEWTTSEDRPADWPDFIVKPDPDGWTGNYPVAYWDERWKDIVIYGKNTVNPHGEYNSVLDEVLLDGFDGVYLDWVEGYEDPDVAALAKAKGLDAAGEMVKFIQEIQAYGKSRNSGFIVIQQNAAELISYAPSIVNYIDAVSQEAVWYDGFGGFDEWGDPDGYDVLNSIGLSNYYLTHLRKYQQAGIPVWNVEYALEHAEKAYNLSAKYYFIPYCTRRSLAKITTTHPPGY